MSNPGEEVVRSAPAGLAPRRGGRSFVGDRTIRLGDVDRGGRLRLDALTRYAQDVSDDDTTDAGLPAEPGWVVRSTVVDQLVPAGLGERLTFVTFCSGLGRRWAERRLSITGEAGARYEVATLWVCIDARTGRPTSLTEQFIGLYGPAADGRTVSARLKNPGLADHHPDGLALIRWQLRATDYDVYDHVNNAAYWAAVEQYLDPTLAVGPLRARLEYGRGLPPAEAVSVVHSADQRGLRLWWLDPDEGSAPPQDLTESTDVAASVAVDVLDPAVYSP